MCSGSTTVSQEVAHYLSNGKPAHICALLSHSHRCKCHNLLLSILKTANNGNLPNHFDVDWCNHSYMDSR